MRNADKALAAKIKTITGLNPINMALYKLALKHSSVTATDNTAYKDHNERLEYLGDAILGAIVADYLFRKYPKANEGFLTELRSRVVNREAMNTWAHKIGLAELLKDNTKSTKGFHASRSVNGDALEALIGAIYLDQGYKGCHTFIVKKLMQLHIDVNELQQMEANAKSKVLEWAQRERKQVKFDLVETEGADNAKTFVVNLIVEGKKVGQGKALNKKKAEQAAAAEFLPQILADNA